MSSTLAELAGVLGYISRLVSAGYEAFVDDQRQQWSVERLWIYAGNLAVRHCREVGIEEGLEPWAELVRARNLYAHYTPGQISARRVWTESLEGVERLRTSVEDS